jgi:hypothetical protein
MIYNSVKQLAKHVRENLKEKKFEDALIEIKKFVENIINIPVINGLVIDLPELDDLCLEVGYNILPSFSVKDNNRTGSIVYIATKLYTSGGHTAVIEDFIKIQSDKRQIVLLTDIFNEGEDPNIKKRFEGLPVELIFAPQNILLQERIFWLQKKWININPEKVFLFNHHQDVVAISTAQPEMPGQLYYYHHTDFQLGLGIRLKHAKHIDLRPRTYFHCREDLNLDNVYCPLTCPDLELAGLKSRIFMEDGIVNTASSSGPHKLLQPYLYSYFEVFPEAMKITGGKHLHIGYLPSETLDLIQKKLISEGILPEKFIYISSVSNVGKAMMENNIDLFISSFPVGGCRTAIEVMASRTPVLCHLNYKSMFLSEYDLFYPEVFTWKNVDELKGVITNLTPDLLKAHSVLARKYYEGHYTEELLKEAVQTDFETVQSPKLKIQRNGNVSSTQLFLDISLEITKLQNKLDEKEMQVTLLLHQSILNKFKNKIKNMFKK